MVCGNGVAAWCGGAGRGTRAGAWLLARVGQLRLLFVWWSLQVLTEELPGLVGSLSFKKSMRWRPDAGKKGRGWVVGAPVGCWIGIQRACAGGGMQVLMQLAEWVELGMVWLGKPHAGWVVGRCLQRRASVSSWLLFMLNCHVIPSTPLPPRSLLAAHALAAGPARRHAAALHLRRPASRWAVCSNWRAANTVNKAQSLWRAIVVLPWRLGRCTCFTLQGPARPSFSLTNYFPWNPCRSAGGSTRLLRNADAPEQQVASADAYQSVLQQGRIRWVGGLGVRWVLGVATSVGGLSNVGFEARLGAA